MALPMRGSNTTRGGINRVTACLQRSFGECSQWVSAEIVSSVFRAQFHRVRDVAILRLPCLERPRSAPRPIDLAG
jgi:hypothetical protein